MNIVWLCITATSLAAVVAAQNIDTSHITVFPSWNSSVAGVFQISYLDDLNRPQYAFNASEARGLCLSLGVSIASKAQVAQALRRGLETCRFGWIDEHYAVIPRITALSNCGKNQTGLVPWRASVTKKFDVFCFNESDEAAQLKDATTQLTSESTYPASPSPPMSPSSPSSALAVTSRFIATIYDADNTGGGAESARSVGSAQDSAGAKAVIIASTCALLLIAVLIVAYIKWRRRSRTSDLKQQKESMGTEACECVTTVKETNTAAEEDERTEAGGATS